MKFALKLLILVKFWNFDNTLNFNLSEPCEVKYLDSCWPSSVFWLCRASLVSGNALMDLGEMDKALDNHLKDLELAQQGWVIRIIQNICTS